MRFKPDPNAISNRIAHQVPTVSLTDEIAETVSGTGLQYMNPEIYFMWIEEYVLSDAEEMDFYWD